MSTGMAETDPERACYICLGEEGELLDDVCACNSAVHAACLQCAACGTALASSVANRPVPPNRLRGGPRRRLEDSN